MPFPAVLSPSSLDGVVGFRIVGETAGDQAGFSVSSAGDINGDGIDDLIIGARGVDVGGANLRAAYVVFGRDTGVSGPFSDVDLSMLDGSDGFEIRGAPGGNGGGFSFVSVAGAGDINGDGIDDLIVGARYAGPSGAYSGGSYVVFGRDAGVAGDFDPTLNLADLDGSDGFRLDGQAMLDLSGWSVASAGDVNGDGIDDLIIGAPNTDHNGANSGTAYVVFGRDAATAGAFPADQDLADLDGTDGFRIEGEAAGDYLGGSVASAGDVNGDGIGDLIVGARYADPNGASSGASYVIFGRDTATAGNFAAFLEVGGLDGLTGFKIGGEAASDLSGWSVASAGDVNDDGVDDLIVGARGAPVGGGPGISYVVFGRDTALSGAFAAEIDLSSLDGTNGFRIVGEVVGDNSGCSVASAGDVNGDGVNDLLIGARNSAENGTGAGAAYVVFGRSGPFVAELELADLDGTIGFQLVGAGAMDQAGFSVSGAGDVNGDGIDDLVVGVRYADASGVDSGVSYVVFGRPSPITYTGGPGDDVANGGSLDDMLYGGDGRDTLHGLAGNDRIWGGEGHDNLFGDEGDDIVEGEGGADKLYGATGEDHLDGGLGADRLDGGGDADVLTGGDGNDYLDGGSGTDVMTGGAANDVYIVDDAGDQTVELAGGGYDIVRTGLSWALASEIEGLELQGTADVDGTGNAGSNNLQGNAGANTLSGLGGVDTINGGDGDDIVIGGLGNDLLRGGLGADTFLVGHAFGTVLETDQVYDFSAAEGDILDLSGAYGGALVLVGAFGKHAGEMTLTFAGGITTLRLDTTGDGRVDYQMKIAGDVTAESGDWLL